MNLLRGSVCFTLLLCTFTVGASGVCDLDGQWYDSSSTSTNEVNVIFYTDMQSILICPFQ